MANLITPIGLKLIKSFVAAPFNSTTVEFIVDDSDVTNLFLNDPVKTINETDDSGIDFCTKATPGDFLRGYVVGFAAEHDRENNLYRAASTRRKVRVCQDPFLVARAQVNAAIATTDIGRYIDMDSGTGNVNTGISEVALDYATINDTTGQFYILQVEEVDSDNDVSIVLCSISKHELLRGVVGTEDFWDRTGTTLTQHYAGDDVDLGAGDITATNAHFTGKLTVDGLIDPTALVLTPQATAPGTDNGTSYYDSVLKVHRFREDGAWHSLSDTNMWQRTGTALAPFNVGDSVTGGLLTTEILPLRNNAVDDLGVDINADGSLSVNTANYEVLVTDNNDVPNKKYVDDILAVGFAKHDFLTVASPGQTAFTLSTTPDVVTTALLLVRGQGRIYGTDFTISGTTLTWLDPGGMTLLTSDTLQVWYDISLTPPSENPLFVAWNNAIQTAATGDGTPVDLAFSQTDANVGNHYNTGTGIFTAPDDGIYEFPINLLLDNIGSSHNQLDIKVIRGGGTALTWLLVSENIGNLRVGVATTAISAVIKIKLDAADTAKFQIAVSGSTKTVNILPGSTYSGELSQEI